MATHDERRRMVADMDEAYQMLDQATDIDEERARALDYPSIYGTAEDLPLYQPEDANPVITGSVRLRRRQRNDIYDPGRERLEQELSEGRALPSAGMLQAGYTDEPITPAQERIGRARDRQSVATRRASSIEADAELFRHQQRRGREFVQDLPFLSRLDDPRGSRRNSIQEEPEYNLGRDFPRRRSVMTRDPEAVWRTSSIPDEPSSEYGPYRTNPAATRRTEHSVPRTSLPDWSENGYPIRHLQTPPGVSIETLPRPRRSTPSIPRSNPPRQVRGSIPTEEPLAPPAVASPRRRRPPPVPLQPKG